MFSTHLKMAITSLRSAKIRTLLTMFGVTIGVSSVLVAVSVGEGVKNQVVGQINQYGEDVVTIVPGKSFVTDSTGKITGFNASASQGISSLTQDDIESINKIKGVSFASPSLVITGVISTNEVTNYAKGTIIATTPDTHRIFDKKIEFGEFFGTADDGKKVVVIGSNIANDVFNQRDPIGRVMSIRGDSYIVRGIFEQAPESPVSIGYNLNNVVYMPLQTGIGIIGENTPINQINVKIANPRSVASITNQIQSVLNQSHGNQEDFTIIQKDDFLQATDQVFAILTTFVAAVAGISLFVGGVGIMNIMLVSVSERTREIGIRKAVGASRHHIINQFMIEAILLSVIGGILGILVSFIAAYFIKLYSPIIPVIEWRTIGIAFGVSLVVGIVFGIAPAIKAATKDPIRSLRQH